jgi:flagellar hook-associated protein 1 FlgK
MSDLLSVGVSGLRAYQTALTTTSNNIANAGTAGYARRTTALGEVTGYNGVTVRGTNRVADTMRAADVRTASADLSRTEGGIVWLERLESALGNSQLSGRIGAFFDAAKGVAANPTAAAPRAVMLEAAGTAAQAFTATGAALADIDADLDSAAGADVQTLNGLAKGLAQVNAGLRRAADGSNAQASLLDQRDSILEKISGFADVAVDYDATGGASVRLGAAGGPVLVDIAGAGTVAYARNDEGAIAFSVTRGGEPQDAPLSGGTLAGIADGTQRVAAARAEHDALATDFAAGVNDLQAQGRDLAGNAGAPLFAVGGPPTQLSVALTDGSGIAAALPGEGTRGNGALAALAQFRVSGDSEGKLTAMTAANGAALAARRTVADAQTAIKDGAVTARDAVSGVSLDEEAVDLIRFQQAYQASSRVVQVAREILQSILAIN